MKLLLWGAGGHAKVVLDVARHTDAFTSIQFLDDAATRAGWFRGHQVLGGAECLPAIARDVKFLVAIGDNRVRAGCYLAAVRHGLAATTLVHPSAVVSPSAVIGDGTVIMPGALINADARVGRNSIVNTGAIVEHDCRVGDHVHIAPGAVLGGTVRVGDYALIGLGSRLLPGVEIGLGALVGAGAVVLDRVPEGATAAGVPSRIIATRDGCLEAALL